MKIVALVWTASSLSRTLEGLYELTRHPSRALDSPRALLLELQRNIHTKISFTAMSNRLHGSMVPSQNHHFMLTTQMSPLSAVAVAFATIVFGLRFVFLWRHISKTQLQDTTQPWSKQTKTEAKTASDHWCRDGHRCWILLTQRVITVPHLSDREADLI